MNYVILLVISLIVLSLIYLFYKINKKDGLYVCMALFSIFLGIISFRLINILSFDINVSIAVIVGILAINNVIIHRYGMDEVKRIIGTFIVTYAVACIIMLISTFMTSSEYNLISNENYNTLFGNNLDNIKYFIGSLVSICLLLYFDSSIYDYIRKNKNNIAFNNIGGMLISLLLESIIFVILTRIGSFNIVEIFGMIVIRYLMEVILGLISLLPIYWLVKKKDR